MTGPEGPYIEGLKREYEQNRDNVWADPNIPHEQKQPEVDRLWREFDQRRTAAREGYLVPEPEAVGGGTPARWPAMPFRKRRRPWK